MNYIKLFENFNKKIIGYHITDYKNLKSILENGLEPRVPEDFGIDGDTKGIYLFKTPQDFIDALSQWFGERIEEYEEENDITYKETLLVVDLTDLELLDTVGFEWTCLDHINPNRIIETYKLFDVDNYLLANELTKKYYS